MNLARCAAILFLMAWHRFKCLFGKSQATCHVQFTGVLYDFIWPVWWRAGCSSYTHSPLHISHNFCWKLSSCCMIEVFLPCFAAGQFSEFVLGGSELFPLNRAIFCWMFKAATRSCLECWWAAPHASPLVNLKSFVSSVALYCTKVMCFFLYWRMISENWWYVPEFLESNKFIRFMI